MSETNPQASTAPTDNAQGINIGNLLGGANTPIPEGMTPPANEPAGTPPVTPTSTASAPTDSPTPPVVPPTPPANEPPAPTDEVDFNKLLLSADGLSEQDAQLRTNILTKFGATQADANGNLLDANGRIVLSAENLDNYILNDELLMDGNGNHVNEFGEIITPAEQVGVTNTFIKTAKTEIEKEYGFQFLGADGKPKSYPNTPQGNTEFVKDVINNTSANAVLNFLNDRPDLKQIFYHLETGGTLDNYVNDTFDYTTVDVTKLTREQKLNYIKTSFDKQGLQNAGSMMKFLETASDEALDTPVTDALLALNKLTADAKSQAEQEYIAQVKAQEEANKKYWEGIKSRIDGGKLKDITIPASEKDKFFDYIATAVDNQGRSQELIDMANEDPDFGLMVSYLRYKKLNLDDLINIRSRGNKLHSARDRFNISQPATVTSAPPAGTKSNGIISLENLQ